jgi:hypothetical protein
MGFESSERKMKTFMSLGTTKTNDNKVLSKFFVITKKNSQGQYEKLPMIDSNNYPKPFYGFLTRITPLLDNVITPPVSSTIRLVIPPGTYVKKVGHLLYKINAWKGMPSEYRKAINGGVIISHAMVKGLIKTGI